MPDIQKPTSSMKRTILLAIASFAIILSSGGAAVAEIKVSTDHNSGDSATPAFKFKTVPSPSKADAGTKAKFTLVDGERDENGGDLGVLHDGQLPTEEDQPGANFFFSQGSAGGRLEVDLGDVTEIQQVNTYSWHANTRGPQVYTLYASDGKADGFNAAPKRGADPEKSGWKLIAKVDTRPKSEPGGQYGVSISDTDGVIGKYRYLLFNIASTESDDDFGNTFYSEIDMVAKGEAVAAQSDASTAAQPPYVTQSTDGKCEITIDTAGAPELTDWATNKLAPALAEWYPKIVALLPSEGFNPPTHFSVTIKPGRGVAATGGTRITANSDWLKGQLKGEAVGSLIHEEVHVVQQYGGGWRGTNSASARPPGYLVEGIPDYIRFYLFEPQTHGAEIRARGLERAKYDGMYRVTANFLNFVVQNYDKDIVTKLNAACRQRKYSDDLWKEYTGKTVVELNDEWKKGLSEKIAVEAAANKLTDEEKAAGWQLLFDGKTFDGWHNFKREGVRPGWQVNGGALVCVDPHNAGDIVTSNQFDWFELQLDYNISEAGNSGIMYHVTDKGGAVWATGPEFQLEDNVKAADPVRCGWLYALYQPPDDPKTGHPLDATKPVGQWNHVRLLVSPEKCEHEINGVKYFEYVLHSDDFNARVAKSKFGNMANFAKSDLGYIALQGDHGSVSFRNIKIRCIGEKKSG